MNTILIICFLTLFTTQIHNHEKIHEDIMKYDGCKEVQIKQDIIKFKATTTCLDKEYKESSNAELLHGYNEITSYNNDNIINILMIITALITTIGIVTINNEKREENGISK